MARRSARRLIESRVRRLTAGASRRRIVDSIAWTLAERVLRLGFTFGVGVVVANSLGVSAFGELHYALALTIILSALVSAGLSGVVFRDLEPDGRPCPSPGSPDTRVNTRIMPASG